MEPESNTHGPKLGLVCITSSDAVRYRTLTRTRFLALDDTERRRVLAELYRANLSRFEGAIDFCAGAGLRLYRATSGLFPFSDEPIGREVLDEMAGAVAAAGRRASEAGLRVVLHPDQFVVLSSDSPHVVENSIKILAMHAHTLDLLEQPRSPWAAMQIHGGTGGRSERLVSVIGELPDPIRSRIALENDERAYSAEEILEVCRAAGVPMVFDAHHHVCREKLTSYDDPSVGEMLAAARATWPVPDWQLVHISNGREAFGDPRHSDLIERMPSSYRDAPWIEVEAKLKEQAIARLRDEWLVRP